MQGAIARNQHQLQPTPETLWLRLLGKGRVQEQAIDELAAFPAEQIAFTFLSYCTDAIATPDRDRIPQSLLPVPPKRARVGG